MFIRGIGSHALSPLRELPLSAVSRVSLRPPESPNMRRRKTLNRMMEKTLRVKEREREKKNENQKKEQLIAAEAIHSYTPSRPPPPPPPPPPLYKYIQMY